MERIRYISVPLNEKGIEDYNYGKEESINIKVFELNEINNSCDLLIDDYESEEISGKNLIIALDISIKNKCKILTQALELAIEMNTLVGLDF